jgi:hypothetical protein
MNELFTTAQIAYYELVHNFRKGKTPSGAAALAPLVGMNPGTLNNKVNPNIDSHHLSAAEGVALQAAARNYAPISAEAATLGGVFTLIEPLDDNTDERLLKLFLELHEEQGETAETVRIALEDGRVSANELKDITREVFEDMAKQMQLLQALTSLSQEQKS